VEKEGEGAGRGGRMRSATTKLNCLRHSQHTAIQRRRGEDSVLRGVNGNHGPRRKRTMRVSRALRESEQRATLSVLLYQIDSSFVQHNHIKHSNPCGTAHPDGGCVYEAKGCACESSTVNIPVPGETGGALGGGRRATHLTSRCVVRQRRILVPYRSVQGLCIYPCRQQVHATLSVCARRVPLWMCKTRVMKQRGAQ